MLEISHRNGSYSNPLVGPRLVSTSCQTEEITTSEKKSPGKNSNFNKIMSSKNNPDNSELGGSSLNPENSKNSSSNSNCTSPLRPSSGNSSSGGKDSSGNSLDSSLVMNGGAGIPELEDAISSPQRPLSSASEESESSISEDDEISFNTIKRGFKLKQNNTSNSQVADPFCSQKQSNTLIQNPDTTTKSPNIFCDENSTCSSSAVSNCEKNVNSPHNSSMKSDGDNAGGALSVVVDSCQTTVLPQINGGSLLHSMAFFPDNLTNCS